MSKPLEPGCLALIVGSRRCPQNNGRVVKLGCFCYAGMLVQTPAGVARIAGPGAWEVTPANEEPLAYRIRDEFIRVTKRHYVTKHLIRIDGDEELVKELQHVEAD